MEDVVIKILPDFTIWKLHSFKEILLFFLVHASWPFPVCGLFSSGAISSGTQQGP